MRIENADTRAPILSVALSLSEEEARELRDALDILLADPDERHEHVSSSDYQTELTVWIDRDSE